MPRKHPGLPFVESKKEYAERLKREEATWKMKFVDTLDTMTDVQLFDFYVQLTRALALAPAQRRGVDWALALTPDDGWATMIVGTHMRERLET
jgi:hypothetical protein